VTLNKTFIFFKVKIILLKSNIIYKGYSIILSNIMKLFTLTLIVTISLTFVLYNIFSFISFDLADAQIITPNQTNIQQNQPLQQQQNSIRDNLMIGSFGNDRISGTANDDIILALSGSDTVHGLAGNDKIQGNEETDQLYGDNANDIVQGGSGSDILYGDVGDDVLAGGPDDDFLIAGLGNDKLYGDIGDDILSGQEGADYFDCGEGVDVIVDFSLSETDDNAGNCEEIQNKLDTQQ
jgi:Ca2+-binding RTX toxin-like protein